MGAIQAITGLPAALITANTEILLVAIGRFVADGVTTARLCGAEKLRGGQDRALRGRIRTGFLFQPPAGVPAPTAGVLVGVLDFGLLHQLIQLPPPPMPPTSASIYYVGGPMTLSTDASYLRATTATEPPPVADAFDTGLAEIRFERFRVHNHGN